MKTRPLSYDETIRLAKYTKKTKRGSIKNELQSLQKNKPTGLRGTQHKNVYGKLAVALMQSPNESSTPTPTTSTACTVKSYNVTTTTEVTPNPKDLSLCGGALCEACLLLQSSMYCMLFHETIMGRKRVSRCVASQPKTN